MVRRTSECELAKLYQHIGMRVKLCRSFMRLSEHDVAERVNFSIEMIRKIEAGQVHASSVFLRRYAKLCKVHVSWFFKPGFPKGGPGKPLDGKQDLSNVVQLKHGFKSKQAASHKRAA